MERARDENWTPKPKSDYGEVFFEVLSPSIKFLEVMEG